MTDISKVPRFASILGFAGVTPFIAGLVLLYLYNDPLRGWGEWILISYGAIILSFMGGVHWGAAMIREDSSIGALGRSVLPSLLALPALAIGGANGLLILAFGFLGLVIYDVSEVQKKRLPQWYPYLRRPLTSIVVASLFLGAYAVH